jgi:DNA invertase Pin-like site-specific DNA recombinase
MIIRFALWAAVSTKPQAAKDKISLPDQIKRGRSAGQGRGWDETSGPFLAPGKSRTGYVDLTVAESEIPALREMLDAARNGLFDVLVVYDYNRLRDLADPVAKALQFYGVQIYSVNQPAEPVDPFKFNPYIADNEQMMRGMSQILSRWQIADLQRKFRMGVSKRVSDGRYGLRFPYGYRHTVSGDRKSPLETDPVVARLIVELKDRFLGGASFQKLADYATNTGIPTWNGYKTWEPSAIVKMISNPFYTGRVFFGRRRVLRDAREGTKIKLAYNLDVEYLPGKQPALWDWKTHQAILAELAERRNDPHLVRHAFSGLLSCSQCKQVLWHQKGFWRCRQGTDHIRMRDPDMLRLVSAALVEALKNYEPSEQKKAAIKKTNARELAELEVRRRRVQKGFEAEIYTAEAAREKIQSIDAQLREMRDVETRALRMEQHRQEMAGLVRQLSALLDRLPAWLAGDDPKTVNHLLIRLCRITITPKHRVRVRFNAS